MTQEQAQRVSNASAVDIHMDETYYRAVMPRYVVRKGFKALQWTDRQDLALAVSAFNTANIYDRWDLHSSRLLDLPKIEA